MYPTPAPRGPDTIARMASRARLLLTLAIASALALALAGSAPAKTTWLCRPGLAKNPCTPSLKTTVYSSWNQVSRVVTPKRVRRPKIDCFYVYPTVSNQPGPLATRAIDPELRSIALYQAARYSQLCRVYAPVYRQITVPALNGGGFTPANQARAYGDVVAAWKEYLKRFNHGRGVVLIGHSQGTFHLTKLVAQRIDRKPALRKRLVSAILLGGNVTVRAGRDVGGSFDKVRACRSRSQLHCVVAFSTFDEAPPANAIFGRTAAPDQVLCTNPAALRGGAATLDAIMPSEPFAPGTLIALGIQLLGIDFPHPATPWVEGRSFSGECSTEGGAGVLRVTAINGTPVPKPSPDATWGLHLMDANVALGDLLSLVRAQAAAYARTR